MQEKQYLSVIMLAPEETSLLKAVSHWIAHYGCQIVKCDVMLHGTFYHVSMLLCASWSAIAKIETKLQALTRQYPTLEILLKRMSQLLPETEKPLLPYVLYVISQDNPHVFYQLMRFLHQQSVVVSEIFMESYRAKNTQTPMVNITVRVQLSTEISISDWRERFMLLCDDMNFDAVMEPEKP